MIQTEHKAGYNDILQVGKSIQGGKISFVSAKVKNILFPIPFDNDPSVTLTLETDANSIPYTLNVTRTGFQIKFRINFTGTVAWEAKRVQ